MNKPNLPGVFLTERQRQATSDQPQGEGNMSRRPKETRKKSVGHDRSVLHQHALRYAEAGIPVFPLRIRDKIPLIPKKDGGNGCKDATTNVDKINEWWSGTPNANIGIAAGREAGCFVLDVDVDKDKGGEESLRALEQKHGDLTKTKTVRTGTGGWHYYFRYPAAGIKNSAGKLGSGLDVRGDGGYVVAPPSIHPKTGEPYEWVNEGEIADAPEWLLEKLRDKPKAEPRPANDNSIPDGQRNLTLVSEAGKLRREGLGAEEISVVLQEINKRRCDPPLPPNEVARVAESIARYPANDNFPLTDVGNAQRLVSRHGDRLYYCFPWKSWLVWDGCRWIVDGDGEITRLTKETARSIAKEAALAEHPKLADTLRAHAKKSQSRPRLEAMISLAQSEVPIAPEALDGNSHLLNLQSGTLDLRSGEFRRHDPGDLITKLAPISYDPDAKCDTWDAFLHKIMDGNADLIAFLKRVVGYSLTGETSEQCLFILHGSGANGKSTFVETIHALLSDYAQKTETKSFMQRQSEGVRNDLARLNGVRFASAVEIGRGQKLDEALIKEVTGGDRIAARFLFKEFFEFQPEFKLFLACNHKPEIRGTDEGMWRRVILVPFDVTIPPEERNKRLPAKLRNELPGILNWAIGGYQEWRRDGLQEPEEVKAATQSYREEMDLLAHFLHECCELGEKKEVPTGELFNAYEEWCKKNGEQAVTKRTFGKMLAERGFRDGSKTKSGVTKRYRFGLSLLPPEF